jgi:hypothetical protein
MSGLEPYHLPTTATVDLTVGETASGNQLFAELPFEVRPTHFALATASAAGGCG